MSDLPTQMNAPNASMCAACAARREKLEAIAAKTGFPFDTVNWVSGAMAFVGKYQRKGASTPHVSAAELCRMLVADLDERDPVRLSASLESIGIRSSRDIGRIVYALIEADLCHPDKDDSESDFASIFEQDEIESYLERAGLSRERDWPVTIKSAIVLLFYLAGASLAIAGTQAAANRNLLWIGSVLLTAGWAITKLRYPKPMRFGLPWSMLELRAAQERK